MATFFARAKAAFIGLRGNTLLVAASPLWISAVFGLFQGRVNKTIVSLAAACCISYGALLTKRFFRQYANSLIHATDPMQIRDERKTALGFVCLGMFILTLFLLRRPPLIAVGTALSGMAYYFHYIYDPDAAPPPLTPDPIHTDHLSPTLRQMITDGEAHIAAIEAVIPQFARNPKTINIAGKLRTMTALARQILSKTAVSPERIRQLRAFFVVTLPELANICTAYLDTPETPARQANFNALLDASLAAFNEQHQAIGKAEHHQLDIKMDVLRQQIHHNHTATPNNRSLP